MGEGYMELVVIVVLIIIAIVVVSNTGTWGGKEPTEAEVAEFREKSKIGREKLNALGDSIKTMTMEQISGATGLTIRTLAGQMYRNELVCADFDGREAQKRFDADKGKSATQLQGERMEKEQIGVLSPKVKCPHCDTVGQVYKKTNATQTEITQSNRLTAAVLEGQKITTKKVTQFHCKNCETTWNV
jgi:hypothetical protein